MPDEPVDLGVGAKYEVTLHPMKGDEMEEEKAVQSLREFLLSIAGTAKENYPSDLARNHDHYLHGRPKGP